MPIKLMLCLVLFCVALPVAASNASAEQPAADTQPATVDDDCDEPATATATSKNSAAANAQDKPPIRRATGDTTVRPPRWHSFLPGMFR